MTINYRLASLPHINFRAFYILLGLWTMAAVVTAQCPTNEADLIYGETVTGASCLINGAAETTITGAVIIANEAKLIVTTPSFRISGNTFTVQTGGTLIIIGNLFVENGGDFIVESGGTVSVSGSILVGSVNEGTITQDGTIKVGGDFIIVDRTRDSEIMDLR